MINNSPFLKGNYAPVSQELSFSQCKIEGELPKDFVGTYLRNGPNPIYPPTPYHWFDGDGMLHAVSIAGAEAVYMNRFVKTKGFIEEQGVGHRLYGGLSSGLPFKNTANTSVISHNGKLLALWEGGDPHSLNPQSLETIGEFNFNGSLSHPFTAHPKIDPKTNEMICFGYNPFARPHLIYSVVNSQGLIDHTVAIDLPNPVMIHDFAITEHYSIFLDLPVVFTPKGFAYKPELGARIGIIPRRGQSSDMRWFQIDPCWVFHIANAHEAGNSIVLTGSRYEKFPNLEANAEHAFLYSWTLNLSDGSVKEGPVGHVKCEFPRINDNHAGTFAKYAYVALTSAEAKNGVAKCNLESGEIQTHYYDHGYSSGEMQFIPRPKAQAEDDGWIAGFVFNKVENRSDLLIISAQDPLAPPLARVQIPARVPYGFHGTWLPQNVLST